jgi:uncharacterized alpha-E superfamily protein
VSLIPTGERPSEINRGADLPSRVADDLYWLGRYTERAWVDLRFLERWWEFHHQGGAENRADEAAYLDAVVKALAILPEASESREEAWKASRLSETIGAIDRISGQVLDRLSLETHRVLREFSLFLEPGDLSVPEALRQVNLRLAAFSGLAMESMTRSPGWLFLDMGRRLERAQMVLETLRASFALGDSEDHLPLLLDLFDSILTYRTRYRLAPQRGPVLDLLLLDETNPRSLAFQLETLGRHVDLLPRESLRSHGAREERAVLRLLTEVRLTDGASLVPGVLEPFLDRLSDGLEDLALALHQTYLAKIDPMESLQARGKGEEP